MLPKPKQYAAAATRTSKLISETLGDTRFVYHNAESAAGLLPGVTINDTESIDKAEIKLESTLETKLNSVNEYDFLFTEEIVQPNNCCYMDVFKSDINDHNEDINEEERIYVTEKFKSEIDQIKTEHIDVDVKEEPHYNYTAAYIGAGIVVQEGDTDTDNFIISNKEQAITIKQESSSDEEVLGDDKSFNEMSQEGRLVVNKSSEMCDVIKESHKGSNNNLSPLRNKRRNNIPPGCKELVLLEDIGQSIYNTEHSSKQVTANVSQSTKHKTINKNEKPIKNRIIFEDDLDTVKESLSDCVDTVKLPQSVMKAPRTTNNKINTNTSMAQEINKSVLSGPEYLENLLITNAKHTKSVVFNCPHCSYKANRKSNLVRHVNTKHTKSEVYKCPHCNYKAYRKSYIAPHVNAKHTKSEVFDCPHCYFKAYTKTNLATHVNAKHTKSEVFNCPHCSYKTYYKLVLSVHVNAKHTKSKVFNCPHCYYKTYTKSHLAIHVNAKHTKTKVFNCPHCSYKAYRKTYLKAHVNAEHTKSEVFKCAHCNYKAYRKSQLEIHVTSKHFKNQVFNCPSCSFKSYNKRNLTTHLKNKHAQ